MTPAVAEPRARKPEDRAWQGRREAVALRTRPTEDTARRRFAGAPDGGRLTLEQKLDRVWEGLHAAGAQAECPVCQSRMAGEGAAAKCRGCGATLA